MVAPFNDLQQRLNRKAPCPKMLRDYPAHVRLYDILLDGNEDLRTLPFASAASGWKPGTAMRRGRASTCRR